VILVYLGEVLWRAARKNNFANLVQKMKTLEVYGSRAPRAAPAGRSYGYGLLQSNYCIAVATRSEHLNNVPEVAEGGQNQRFELFWAPACRVPKTSCGAGIDVVIDTSSSGDLTSEKCVPYSADQSAELPKYRRCEKCRSVQLKNRAG
jgi:hypothetical protein